MHKSYQGLLKEYLEFFKVLQTLALQLVLLVSSLHAFSPYCLMHLDKLIELFWNYWVYYVIYLIFFLTDISNKWSWSNNISLFTFSKMQFNMKFCFYKANNVIYSKVFQFRKNSYLNILALKNWSIINTNSYFLRSSNYIGNKISPGAFYWWRIVLTVKT